MFSFNMLLSVLALTLLVLSAEASTGGTPNHNYDLSGQALTDLYNTPVQKAEWMVRPLGNLPGIVGPVSHTGVRVKLDDDSEWLVHKGSGYGRSSQTVVTDAEHMSPAWETDRKINVERETTVSDLVDAGGANYNPLCSNCHHATRDMERRLG
uniref:Cytochrome c domain-containing protein n=1 Tax=Lates calcarifer TaxID=8187 RepID=A0A4W6DQC8_LATCA